MFGPDVQRQDDAAVASAGPVSEAPEWLRRVRPQLDSHAVPWFRDFTPPGRTRSQSAVLMLFGSGSRGAEVVLTERAHDLRSHAAQISFPGGRIDPTDAGPIDAALREADEEVGLERLTVTVVDTLPALHLAVSDNAVTPVLGWWHEPHPIGVVDPGEVAQVVRHPVDQLLDPAHRFTAVAPMLSTPGFDVGGLFVWGFTAMLLDHVFNLAGISRPWNVARERPVPTRLMADREP